MCYDMYCYLAERRRRTSERAMAAAALVPAMCVHHCSLQCDRVHRSASSSSSSSGLACHGSFSAEALFLRGQTRVLSRGKGRFQIVVRASSSLKDGERREPPTTAPVNPNKQEQQRDARDDNREVENAVVAQQDNPTPEARGDEGGISGDAALKGTVLAGLLLLGTVGGFSAFGYYYKDQINEFLLQFSEIIEGYGPAGYALFVAVYAGLEVLAIPAIPLTMSAGLLFGTWTGIIIVSISGTIAATLAFLIARYLARDRILKIAEGNKKFLAIDKAIGENGFRVVALLRLSPLLPFSIGNYLYGLTSVKLVPYVLGSWLGMLPGTWAYVSAGAFGRALIEESESNMHGGPQQLVTLGLGLLATVLAATYVTRLAKDSVKDLE